MEPSAIAGSEQLCPEMPGGPPVPSTAIAARAQAAWKNSDTVSTCYE